MKILVVGAGSSRTTFLDRLIRGLAGQGIQVTLATARRPESGVFDPEYVRWLWTPAWEGSIISKIFILFALSLLNMPSKRLSWLFNALSASGKVNSRWIELYRLLPFTRGNWDVIYFPWNSAAIGYQALYDLGIPVVVSCRGSQINIRPHTSDGDRYIEQLKPSLKKAAAVHCVSRDILNEVVAYGLDPQNAWVIHPAVDPDFFAPLPEKQPNSRFITLATGSLVWLKGYEYALMAIRQLVDLGIDAEFHIIGAGPERQRLLFTIQDLNLEGRVMLHGSLPPQQVRGYLRQADAFLLSSLSEGISNAVLEAMSCGVPVVTTNCGGMREAVTDGTEGFVVPVRDPAAMAQVLRKLAKDSALRDRMGKAGRERVQNQFDQQYQASSFEELFSEVWEKSI